MSECVCTRPERSFLTHLGPPAFHKRLVLEPSVPPPSWLGSPRNRNRHLRLPVHRAEAAGWWPPTAVHRGPAPAGVRGRPPHLAHLQLEDPPLLLHLLRDLGPADLGADHPVQPGVLLLLLLDFRSTGEKKSKIKSDALRHAVQTGGPGRGPVTSLRDKRSLSLLETWQSVNLLERKTHLVIKKSTLFC